MMDDIMMRIQHGYDRGGNRLYRRDMVATTAGQALNELYTYDQMNQLTSMERGVLNTDGNAISNKTFGEQFTFDMTGNWLNYKRDANGDGTFEVDQTRTHNLANEILTISSGNTPVSHDRNGCMTKVPKPNSWSSAYTLVYDAWNRLTQVKDGTMVVATYVYDARNHRIKKTVGDETRLYYFNQQWQCIEERVGTTVDATWIYGLRYIDDVICRTTSNNGETQTLYALQDPNWNVCALVNASGTVAERLTYDSFGRVTFRNSDFTTKVASSYGWTKTFTGQVYDTETGLMLYRNRYYHPTLGRFITRDPIGYEGDGVNFYRYVGNSVAKNTDIFGFITCNGGVWTATGTLFSMQLFLGYATGQVEFKCAQSHVVGIRTCSVGNEETFIKEIYATPVVQADISAWLAGVGLGASYYGTLFRVENAPTGNDLNSSTCDAVASIGIGVANASGSWIGNGGSADVGPSGLGITLLSLQHISITVVNSFYQYGYEGLTVGEAQFLSDRRAAGHKICCSDEPVAARPTIPTAELSVSEWPRQYR